MDNFAPEIHGNVPAKASALVELEGVDDFKSLSKCQVDTPANIVEFVWTRLCLLRSKIGKVVDFGCGDGRFANFDKYTSYTGFEIDPVRAKSLRSRVNQKVHIACAFDKATAHKYDVCVGNPPYIKHHDLSVEWLQRIESKLSSMIDYSGDGRSNAYIYFFWLALASVKKDGLVALVIPFEWVSRPASAKLRNFIQLQGWHVDIYFLQGAIFDRVLTTACVAIIDKSAVDGHWQINTVSDDGTVSPIPQPTMTTESTLIYERAIEGARAIRGLSPGGQDIFVLTEEERIRFRLAIGTDVVPAVTTFRHIDEKETILSAAMFRSSFVDQGARCWLINTDNAPSAVLIAYLEQVSQEKRSNWTCSSREIWWRYPMPKISAILYASGFIGIRPKILKNEAGAVHVGGVHGIRCGNKKLALQLISKLQAYDFSSRVVGLSNGFKKVEVNQMNGVLNQLAQQK